MDTSLEVFHKENKSCDRDVDNPGCCQTESKNFKVSDSHVASDVIFHSPSFSDYLPTTYFRIISFARQPMGDVANASHAPPLHYGLSVYKLYCVYRI